MKRLIPIFAGTGKSVKAALPDFVLLLLAFGLLYGLARVGSGMFAVFIPPKVEPQVVLSPANLPYYAARSTLRMFAALALSLGFTLAYGSMAAKSRRAERVLIPLLDVLQSVPVLGFLSITVTGFIALFPGSLLGLECASIFAIFTGQAWNMAFSFYNSLITLPRDLDEAAKLFRLSPAQRFVKLELPASMIGLVWNGMMSFGGGWFFLAASEAISVLNRSYTLPGLGSFVAKAVQTQNVPALGWSVLTMAVVVLLVDQFFWRPLVAWSDKFKLERSSSGEPPTSWVYDLIRSARLPALAHRLAGALGSRARALLPTRPSALGEPVPADPRRERFRDAAFAIGVGALVVLSAVAAVRFVIAEVSIREIGLCAGYGVLTLMRVTALVLVSSLVWTPVGVAIGFNPKLARVGQPVVQFLSSFPANFLFPLAAIVFIRTGLSLNWGSMLLMALGAQWYILFNVIAGAMAVPTDMREMAANMRLTKASLWRKVIFPAIFPAWVTGAITASGGAWNASIVSEVVRWGDHTLTAQGLGAYIARATGQGDWPRIVLGVALMSLFVVGANRLLWRPLYTLAEERFRLI